MNRCSYDLIHGIEVDEGRSSFDQMALELYRTLRQLGEDISKYERSCEDASDQDKFWIEEIRSAAWEDFGLAAEIETFKGGEDFNSFDQLTDQLLGKCHLHTRRVVGSLEFK